MSQYHWVMTLLAERPWMFQNQRQDSRGGQGYLMADGLVDVPEDRGLDDVESPSLGLLNQVRPHLRSMFMGSLSTPLFGFNGLICSKERRETDTHTHIYIYNREIHHHHHHHHWPQECCVGNEWCRRWGPSGHRSRLAPGGRTSHWLRAPVPTRAASGGEEEEECLSYCLRSKDE